MTAPGDETTRDYSRANPADRPDFGGLRAIRPALIAVGALGAVALILSDLSAVFSVSVPGGPTRAVSGHHQHAFALLIDGLASGWLLLSAWRGVRLAMFGLAVMGLLAFGIAVLVDLPDVHSTGVIGALYATAQAQPEAGFYEETLGAALLLISGGGLLLYQR